MEAPAATRHRDRPRRPWAPRLAALAVCAYAVGARAEDAQPVAGRAVEPSASQAAQAAAPAGPRTTLVLRDGASVTGALVELVPGDHVTVRVGSGEPVRFDTAQVATIAIEASAPVAATPSRADAVDPHTAALFYRRTELLLHPVGVGGPMTLTIIGSVLAVAGLGIALPSTLADCSNTSANCSEDLGSAIGVGTLGLVGAIAGGLWLRQRRSERSARAREIQDIELELTRGMSPLALGLAPMLAVGRGASFGVRAAASF
jgi:hypothetical protein